MRQSKTLRVLMAALIALTMTTAGCGAPIGESIPYIPFDADLAQANEKYDLGLSEEDNFELNKAMEEADIAMVEVEALEVEELSEKKLKGIKGFLKAVFGNLFKILKKVKDKVEKAKLKIQEQMAKLDPTNPAHVVLLMKLQKVIDKLDEYLALIDFSKEGLIKKVFLVIDKLDVLLLKLNPVNPLHWVAGLLLNVIKSKLKSYFRKLIDKI